MNKRLFAIDPWRIALRGLPEDIRLMESITSIGNGAMGMRGNFEEGFSGDSHRGTYIAGVWFPDKTRVGWWKNGYPAYFGKVINAVNILRMDIAVNGHAVDLAVSEHEDFSMALDMRSGVLEREYIHKGNGARVRFRFRRFLSIAQPELAYIRMEAEALEGRAEIRVASMLDGNVRNEDSNYEEVFWDVLKIGANSLTMRTRENPFGTPRFTMTASMDNAMTPSATASEALEEAAVGESFACSLEEGASLRFDKRVCLFSDRDVPLEKQAALCKERLAAADSFDVHLEKQRAAWARRWEQADVRIEGDEEAQQGIRFNIFQLFSTYYGEDERLNIGPKGFTGEKYGGATYWDTEAYIFPMYLSIAPPEVAQKLLRYRHRQLEGAFHNAKQLRLAGALYPMVTFNGIECHNEWEITFEEIHRNGAIAHAIYDYTTYTGDESYALQEGLDVLVGISRFWADRVHFSSRQGKYMLHGVTGPNEYDNNVNNNWYTNYIARWTLRYTLELLAKAPERERSLSVMAQEKEHWQDIIDRMALPYDEQLGVFVMHDTFLDKELRPADSLSPEDRPLNQHWSWDRILRSCFIKQGDVLQGMYFFNEDFSLEEKRRNFNFYEPMTVHESSLSACIHAILASELGYEQKALELYARTARLDLDNYNNDSEDGLHITSMSGSWLAIVHGFAGMRFHKGQLSFAPFCPSGWQSYSFAINYRGRRIRVTVSAEGVAFSLEGEPLEILLHGKAHLLEAVNQ